jgi:hypothetical protein
VRNVNQQSIYLWHRRYLHSGIQGVHDERFFQLIYSPGAQLLSPATFQAMRYGQFFLVDGKSGASPSITYIEVAFDSLPNSANFFS